MNYITMITLLTFLILLFFLQCLPFQSSIFAYLANGIGIEIQIRNNDLLQVDAPPFEYLQTNHWYPTLKSYCVAVGSWWYHNYKTACESWRYFYLWILLSSTDVHCSFSMQTQTICFRAKSSNFMLFRLWRFELLLLFFCCHSLKSLESIFKQMNWPIFLFNIYYNSCIYSHQRFNLLLNSEFF